MPIQVTPLTEADIPGAITTIQEAFASDPYNLWVYNDRSKIDLNRNRVSLGIRCRWGIRNALFHVAKEEGSERVLGLAMWIPPRAAHKPLTWHEWFWDSFEGWRLWGSQVAMNLRQVQKELWTDPRGYYFLNIITVLPSQQGKGIGRALFQEVTRKADEDGIPCYLESSRDEPNIKIYEAVGFRFVKAMDCDDDGAICKLFCMIRDAQVRG
ncbi:MAG: hypothetical protein M1818_001708 [Claussenomyces sp. TS43310]|nr:MAG: hypothetical protein M1818_001708 [Claussenomyces sp. TS43310]